MVPRTDPTWADTDGDGYDDATELNAGSDPTKRTSIPRGDATPIPGDDEPTSRPATGKPAAARVTARPNTGAGPGGSDETSEALVLASGAGLPLVGGGAAVAQRRA